MMSSALLSRAARLRPGDLPALARALGWMVLARVVLGLWGFGAMQRMIGLEPHGEPERVKGPRPSVPARTERVLRVTLRALEPKTLGVTCLPRAIVLERTLIACGMPADLILGCVTDDGFRAHAWVEVDGHTVGFDEGGPASWRPLARFRSSAARTLGARAGEEAA